MLLQSNDSVWKRKDRARHAWILVAAGRIGVRHPQQTVRLRPLIVAAGGTSSLHYADGWSIWDQRPHMPGPRPSQSLVCRPKQVVRPMSRRRFVGPTIYNWRCSRSNVKRSVGPHTNVLFLQVCGMLHSFFQV